MIWQLAMLGFGLGLNNALGSVALGTQRMKRLRQLRIGLIFAAFEAAMPMLGIFVGRRMASLAGHDASYAGVAVLSLLGIYLMFKKGDQIKSGEAKPVRFVTVMLAIMLSLDNLTVGFGLGMLHVPLMTASLMFGSISLLMTLAGLELGRFMGEKVNVSVDKLSGGILLFTGVLMALH